MPTRRQGQQEMNEDRLNRLYNAQLPIYSRALARIKSCLLDVIEDFAKDRLFRVSIVNERVKPFKSLLRKARENGIEDDEEVLGKITDVIGVRLVTYNLKDTTRLVEAIKSMKSLKYIEESLQDYVRSPKSTGYRAIHFDVYCDVEYKGDQHKIRCEVQIQTLFQNSWAILTHQDIYKSENDLPGHVVVLSRRLADQLAILDDIAQDIRDAASAVVQPSEAPDDAAITKSRLADVYYNRFGASIHDYQIQVWMNALVHEGACTMGQAKALLPTDAIIDRLASIYRDVWGTTDIPEDTMLSWGVRIMGGVPNAFRQFRSAIEAEYQDLMAFARREALSELPNTVDELIKSIRDGDIGIQDIWHALKEIGGLSECGRCGEFYFDSYAAYEGLIDHYGADNTDLLDLLYEAEAEGGFEVESADSPGYCSYCGYMMSKD
jgi:ppGpp synthetase/RelA/SpoT-type nucleotidyltranferase